MLTREQARDQLTAFQVEGGRERRLAAARGLKPSLKDVAVAFLDLPVMHGWGEDAQRWAQERLQKIEQIESLGAPERQQLFKILFPTIHNHVETAWRKLYSMPYQVGHHRRAFRAPRTAEATHVRR